MGETAKLHSDLEALIGSTIHDRYEIETLLGAGGMGAVFRARHTGLKKGVAIKVLHPEIGRDESVSKRFDREAHSASRLDHPNCVRVTDFGTTDNGTKYLVMELLEGGDLDGQLGKPWDPKQAVAIIQQVLYGLEHAHHVGIVHRDLKPENIFITKDFKGDEVVKIVDFGIAKLIDERGSEKLTRAGIVFGTPRYMSPEQAAGGKIDERTDLYAVGLILYELLAGHSPFVTDDPAQLLRMQIMAPPPPLPDSVPPALAKVVEKLLEKSKMDRFASAREVLDALEQAAISAGPSVAAAAVVPAPTVPTTAPTAPINVVTGPNSTPASSGAAWQPAPEPTPAISGATLATPAADLAAVSMSAHSGVSPTGSHASVGQPATGPFPTVPSGPFPTVPSGSFPTVPTGSHASLASGPHPHLSGSHASMSVASVATADADGSRKWLPIVLAAGVLLLVVAGVSTLLSLLGDESSASKTDTADQTQEPPSGEAAAGPSTEGNVDGVPKEAQDGQPDSAVVPAPVRDAKVPSARPIHPSKSGSNSSATSKPKATDSKATDSKATDSKPSDSGGSSDPSEPRDPGTPSGTVTDSATDASGSATGLDPRQAEKEREAAAEREKQAKQREAEQSQDKPHGKGKDKDKKKVQ